MAGSKYHNYWSCNTCDYKSWNVQAPIRIEPEEGVRSAEIEYRWCHNCDCIQRVFTGKGEVVKPGNSPDSPIAFLPGISFEKLDEMIMELELKGKNDLFSFSTKDAEKLEKYRKTREIDKKFNQDNIDYYEKLNPAPRCLHCSSKEVSSLPHDQDKHSCGGSFLLRSERFGSVKEYLSITYTSDGKTSSEIVQMK